MCSWQSGPSSATSTNLPGSRRKPARRVSLIPFRLKSARDCEDLARLWIALNGLADYLSRDNVTIAVKWRNIKSGAPKIRLFRAIDEAAGGLGYLHNPSVGAAQASGNWANALSGEGGDSVLKTGNPIILSGSNWSGTVANAGQPVLHLLFEGVEEGCGELCFEIRNAANHKMAEVGSVWIELRNIKKLYSRVKTTPWEIPEPYGFGAPPTPRSPFALGSLGGVVAQMNVPSFVQFDERQSFANTSSLLRR